MMDRNESPLGISIDDQPAARRTRAYPSRLAVREKERIRLVPVESIVWIQAERNYCLLHAPEGQSSLRSTLYALEKQLDPRLFARIHRSSIVALAQIRELGPTLSGEYAVTLRDGTALHCSRAYLARLQKFLDLAGG